MWTLTMRCPVSIRSQPKRFLIFRASVRRTWNANCSFSNTPCRGGCAMLREEIYFTVVVVSIVLAIDVMALYVYFKRRP